MPICVLTLTVPLARRFPSETGRAAGARGSFRRSDVGAELLAALPSALLAGSNPLPPSLSPSGGEERARCGTKGGRKRP